MTETAKTGATVSTLTKNMNWSNVISMVNIKEYTIWNTHLWKPLTKIKKKSRKKSKWLKNWYICQLFAYCIILKILIWYKFVYSEYSNRLKRIANEREQMDKQLVTLKKKKKTWFFLIVAVKWRICSITWFYPLKLILAASVIFLSKFT